MWLTWSRSVTAWASERLALRDVANGFIDHGLPEGAGNYWASIKNNDLVRAYWARIHGSSEAPMHCPLVRIDNMGHSAPRVSQARGGNV